MTKKVVSFFQENRSDTLSCRTMTRPLELMDRIQGGPAKVRPPYIIDGNI